MTLARLRPTAVVFDLDDTLVVDHEVARSALRAAAASVPGHRPRDDDVDRLLGVIRPLWRSGPHHDVALRLGIASWEGLWATFEGSHPVLDGLRGWIASYRDAAWRAAAGALGATGHGRADAMARRYVAAQRTARPVVEGAPALVHALAGRMPVGLLTNGPADTQRRKLAQSGLAGSLAAVVVSGELGVGKPEPGAFRAVLRALGTEPDGALMVGDDWHRDIEGARAAGMQVAWLAGGRAPPEPDTTLVVQRLRDLAPFLLP